MHKHSDTQPNVGRDERARKPAAGQPTPTADLPLRHFVLLYCLAIVAIAVIIVLVTMLPKPGARPDDAASSGESTIIEQDPIRDE